MEEQKPYIIYHIEHKSTGDFYIGSTFSALEERWKDHIKSSKDRVPRAHFHKVIKVYGPDAFILKKIDCGIGTRSEKVKHEFALIGKFQPTLNQNGYYCSAIQEQYRKVIILKVERLAAKEGRYAALKITDEEREWQRVLAKHRKSSEFEQRERERRELELHQIAELRWANRHIAQDVGTNKIQEITGLSKTQINKKILRDKKEQAAHDLNELILRQESKTRCSEIAKALEVSRQKISKIFQEGEPFKKSYKLGEIYESL
jgi:hypothetical protein